jgi:membrane protein DedA with SNARE-associated domain
MTSLIETWGAFGVFVLMVPESACIPVPSEVTLLFAGFAVGEGWMSFPLAIVAATAGNLVGSLLAYGLGASRLIERLPGGESLMDRSRGLLDRHGSRAVFLARLLPLARTFISLPAGAQGVPLTKFVVLTTVGCAIWAIAFVLVGLAAGTAWSAVSASAGWGLLAVGVVVVGIALWSGGRRRSS